ncbi:MULTISPECIES: cell division protein FtsL [Photobacterium]|uniref:Cell division protein FtsL n=1 Tax=Photobacterium ganghwense TaxID=320778 RepID=A0A0J1H3J0_9GAMM|nr:MULTISPECIES: cell division protein FtsL [Photobacterium]KLV06356.1 cell division protein FtsL [Photobacterium ganghwense]MBV1840233.1 cell division protein FtsL [Photobacterium ganghwense]PSU06720.1 cell division protein FtsL [Photobacterium ganghwense]QSV14434.1 cell division protein FtsL [Photobacterium ganghwense]
MKSAPEPTDNLARLIGRDLLSVGRFPLFLLVLVLISALGVVLITHHSRQLIAEQEQLLIERDQLDIEWRNQILEENSLAEHSRIERLAEKDMEMKRPSRDNEVIVHE